MSRRPNPPAAQHSPAAEKAMLGACLLTGAARDLLVKDLAPGDFYLPAHQTIAEGITAMHTVGAAVDPVTVATWIVEHHDKAALENAGGLAGLMEMMADCPASTSGATYAATIRDRAARRQLKAALLEGLERVDDLAVGAASLVEETAQGIARVDAPVSPVPSQNAYDFMDQDMEYRWLVPGWLERGDRTIITGSEGSGKSVVCRQMAVQLAAGIHPWRPERPNPVTVELMDFENSQRQVYRKMAHLIEQVATNARQMALGAAPPPVFDPDRLRIEVRPAGIDLLTRVDRAWFTGCIEATRPDILVTGPIYKLHRGNPNDEEPAAELAAYFDRLRDRYDIAIILEAHSPHGTDGGQHRTLRPVGASLWMRWPEFGYGIRKTEDAPPGTYDWVPWRPARDDGRAWPHRIRRGTRWPWVSEHVDEEGMEAPF